MGSTSDGVEAQANCLPPLTLQSPPAWFPVLVELLDVTDDRVKERPSKRS
jgi:hypothetical protein